MSRPSQRSAILDAAERVVIAHGAGKMTLDAVAAEAGVGKGGLMYHFPSKQALLEGLVGRLIEQYESCLEAVEADPTAGGNLLQTHLRALVTAHVQSDRLGTAMLAVAANAPELLAAAAARQRQDIEPQLAQGQIGAAAVALQFAIHGVFMMERLGATRLSKTERDRIIAAILDLARDIGGTLASGQSPTI
jgi:AcrR family transcriptional regulator